ncbi:relaxase domain-containing protein [Nocardia rhamnosiphila]|uniref:relaxase domain-containing protein n=1 Tax=Nocardia rhamnosiphila TaxID=426716 RepID=UPI0033F6F034
MFAEETGRLPLDEHELSSWVARAAQPRPNSVAGFDLTFTPVKSVSVLWGLSEPEDGAVIEAGHRAAIGEVVEFLENEVVFTRRGAGGVRQIERPTTTPNASISTRRTSRPPTTSRRETWRISTWRKCPTANCSGLRRRAPPGPTPRARNAISTSPTSTASSATTNSAVSPRTPTRTGPGH